MPRPTAAGIRDDRNFTFYARLRGDGAPVVIIVPHPSLMPVIRLRTYIRAPLERCFDLASSIDAHMLSTSKTKERAVAGITSGQIHLGETVTWEAVHFGVKQRLSTKITRFERPHLFVDEMVSGAFRSFTHLHEFQPVPGGTLMLDTFRYASPLGLLGRLADRLFLEHYMRTLLVERNRYLKHAAEMGLT